jgi:glycosyltransferase involved in cell wall biosynthesis
MAERILIFAPYYVPHTYGLSVHIDEFSKLLSRRVKEITIFTPHLFKDSPEEEVKYGKIRIIRFPAFYIVFNYPFPKIWKLKFWKLLIALFRENKYDLVISNMRFFVISLFALFYSKIKKVRWIHIEHGSDHIIMSNKIKELVAKFYDLTMGLLIFRFSDINIATSSEMKKFINKFDKRNVPVILNSLNIKNAEAIKSDQNLKNLFRGKIIISFLGRICKYKGIEESVKIIKSLPEDLKSRLVFVVMGYGEDYEKIKKIINGDESIKLLGELPRDKAIGILKISDIYIHSSLPGGGVSSALQEAMFCKCAVLCTPNEGVMDLIKDGENGIIFQDKKEMKQKLISLISNVEKINFYGEEAHKTIKNSFDWEKSIEKYWELINI